jgi:TetR/AcrR family transcriptional regulator, transcriptional repressor for nem operon
MDVFWTRGYHATSLPDLLEATKLSRGSLYAAFGDKRELFLRALDRYTDGALARLDAELDSHTSPLASIRGCVDGYVDRTSGAKGKRGCLLVATAMELAAHDVEVNRRIRRFFAAMEARLSEAFIRARTHGELAAGVEPASAARMLVCQLEGMRVVGKIGPDRATSEAACVALLDLLAA